MTRTLRCGAMGRFWPYRTGAMQDPVSELPRIPIPRRWVNKLVSGRIAPVSHAHNEEHPHDHHHGHGGHGHTHGAVDPTLVTSERGIWAIKWSFVGLMATALLHLVVVLMSGSVAL